MTKNKSGVKKLIVLTPIFIVVVFLVVFFLQFNKEQEITKDNAARIEYNSLKVSCSDNLKVSLYEEDTYCEPSNYIKKDISNDFIDLNTSGNGENFVSDLGNPKFLSLKLKFEAVQSTNVYLSDLSQLISCDEDNRKTGLAGMSRIAFLNHEHLLSVIVLNDLYENKEETLLFNGSREETYFYKNTELVSYTLDDILEQNIVFSSTGLASYSNNLVNNSPLLLSLNNNDSDELEVRIWFESTDRENALYENNKVAIRLDFAGLKKLECSENEEKFLSGITHNPFDKLLYYGDRLITVSDGIAYSFDGIDFYGPYNETGHRLDPDKYEYVYIKKFETNATLQSNVYRIKLLSKETK